MKHIKFFCLIVLFVFSAHYMQAQQENFFARADVQRTGGGIGIGSIIAIVASWSRNRSVLWAIFHALCGWLYVIYYLLSGGRSVKNY